MGHELSATIAEGEKGKLDWCEMRYEEEEKRSEVVVKTCCELGDANHGLGFGSSRASHSTSVVVDWSEVLNQCIYPQGL